MNTLLELEYVKIKNTPITFSYHFKLRQKERNIPTNDVCNSLSKVMPESYINHSYSKDDFIIVDTSLKQCLIVCFSSKTKNNKSLILKTCFNKIPRNENGTLRFRDYSEIIYV